MFDTVKKILEGKKRKRIGKQWLYVKEATKAVVNVLPLS